MSNKVNLKEAVAATLNMLNAGFSLGTTSTYTTAANTSCCINGKFATALASGSNVASPTTDARTGAAFVPMAANRATVVVAGVNAAGAIKYCQGSVEETETGSGNTVGAFKRPPQFPNLPDDFCPIAYWLVRTAPNAAAFTVGTTSWTATAVTCSTPVNITCLPDRPQTS